MQNNLVSIAMATYNGEKYLIQQLDSILTQTYKDLEIIICDDKSLDNTVEIIKEYQKTDSRIKFFPNEINLGFKKNFEKAISLCNGNYIALSDQDDIWEKDKIEILLNNIKDFDLIHSACSLIDENSLQIAPKWLKEDDLKYSFTKFVFGNSVTGCTVLFKKSLLKDFFPISKGEYYHDWWLALLAIKGNGIIFFNEPLVKYRQHSIQDTGANVDTLKKRLNRYYQSFFNKKNSLRYKVAKRQVERLESFLNEKANLFSDNEKYIIKDAIKYYKNYLNNFVHIGNFFISLKYNEYMYYKNKFYLKNIFRDLVG